MPQLDKRSGTELMDRQLKRLSEQWFCWPSFPGPLEDRFEADTSERRCRRLWIEGLIAIALYDLFLITDFFASSTYLHRALLVRLMIVTPICLIVNASMLQRPQPVVRETSIAFGAILAGMTQLWLQSQRSAVTSAYAQLAVLAVILFANVVMQLQTVYAILASAIMLAGDLFFLRIDRMQSQPEEVLGFAMVLAITAITLVTNFSLNREERLNYLLSLRDESLVSDLNRLNSELLRRSESDALTGLANRHSFDQHFMELWKRTSSSGTALSVIVVDVDHFKQLNDRYGHLYGDEVLRRIGSLLQQALRAKDDFAARFGGEEFIILLPGTPRAAAQQVAERLCKMVELAGFPPLGPEHTPYNSTTVATVSCGVATTYPTHTDDPQRLLEAADKAMYQAKRDGRNRVACAPWTTLVQSA